RGLYLYTLGDRKLFSWRLDGIGTSTAFAPDDAFLTVGTWDNSGVSCFALSGASRWLYPVSPDRRQALTNRLFATSVSQNGHSVLAVSYANARQGDATLALWRSDGTGTPSWTQELGSDAFFPKAAVSADGSRVAVSYLRVITRGDQSLAEHRLRLLDSSGNVLWEKGGLLFSPSLVGLAPDGKRITISDGQNTLYTLNDEGRIMAHTALGGAIRDTRPSADGRFLLVYTGDGVLSLLRYD
ncbi:MAG: WD40 repeat domain-containing protein, partial [Armatimonadota bacterium]|nr:WD40 repeat domain-containing protein [Armatimonadota bacterium]